MTQDSAQSPRIGQRLAPEGGSKIEVVTSQMLPSAPWPGRMVYAADINRLLLYSGDVNNWILAGASGVTFVQADPPEDIPIGVLNVGDQWLDTDDDQLYIWQLQQAEDPDLGLPAVYGWEIYVDPAIYKPYVELGAATFTTVADDVDTLVTLDSVIHNDSDFYDLTTNPNKVTLLQDGIYDVDGRTDFTTLGSAATAYTAAHLDWTGFGNWDRYFERPENNYTVGMPLSIQHGTFLAGAVFNLGLYQSQVSGVLTRNSATARTRLIIRKMA